MGAWVDGCMGAWVHRSFSAFFEGRISTGLMCSTALASPVDGHAEVEWQQGSPTVTHKPNSHLEIIQLLVGLVGQDAGEDGRSRDPWEQSPPHPAGGVGALWKDGQGAAHSRVEGQLGSTRGRGGAGVVEGG